MSNTEEADKEKRKSLIVTVTLPKKCKMDDGTSEGDINLAVLPHTEN